MLETIFPRLRIAATVVGLSAIAMPQAAIDDAGMQYTSAAEGFYGSLRLALNSEEVDGSHGGYKLTGITQRASRLGVRGSHDLGRGLTATYQYEFNVFGKDVNLVVPSETRDTIGQTRLHNVGLEGPFGSLLLGTQWSVDYNYVWGNTDIMNSHKSGNVLGDTFVGRESNVITYASPEFDGFNFAVGLQFDPSPTNVRCITQTLGEPAFLPTGPNIIFLFPDCDLAESMGIVFPDKNSEAEVIDRFSFGIGYSRGGWDVGGTYAIRNNPLGFAHVSIFQPLTPPVRLRNYDDDIEEKVHGFHLGYARNNWKLNYFYGSARSTFFATQEKLSNSVHSLAGQIEIKKVTLRALRETSKLEVGNRPHGRDQTYNTIGVQYDLGIKSRVYFEYYVDELDDPGRIAGNNANADAELTGYELGYRVDF